MASINDKFGRASIPTGYASATTVKTARSVGGSVLECYDLSKFAQDTPVHYVTYKKVTNPQTGAVDIVNQVSYKALVNIANNTLINVTVSPGYTDIGNAEGDYVECIPTSQWENDLVDGILTHANQDGTLKNKSVTLTNLNGGTTAGLLATDTSGNVSVISTQESWKPVTYASGWGDYDPGTEWYGGQYMKDSVGIVHLAGLIKNTSGSTKTGGQLFTLPVGYRPLFKMRFATSFSGNGGAVDVKPDGIVTTTASIASNDWISLSNISFKAG